MWVTKNHCLLHVIIWVRYVESLVLVLFGFSVLVEGMNVVDCLEILISKTTYYVLLLNIVEEGGSLFNDRDLERCCQDHQLKTKLELVSRPRLKSQGYQQYSVC